MQINPLLNDNAQDKYLYNLNLKLSKAELSKFGQIKYVCMQGSNDRAKDLAQKLAKVILNIDANYFAPINLIPTSKYKMYRIGNILSVSHGMGSTSILTLLHNLTKLIYYAGNVEVEYIRIGTSGGINVTPGSVIITKQAFMPDLVAGYKISALGKDIIYPTNMDANLNARILQAQPKDLGFPILIGNSIAADDFYQGQARFDGAIAPKYDVLDRQQYFTRLQQLNILNFEMESTALASFCNRVQIPATMVAVTLLNRFTSDQVTASSALLDEYSNRSQTVVINYLKSRLI